VAHQLILFNSISGSHVYIYKSNPITGLDRPWGFQEVEDPRFQEIRHMKVVRLSALRTGRLYPPGNFPGTHFCKRLNQTQSHSATEGLCQWKIPMTSSGIEPSALRLVAQCLNQHRHCVCHIYIYSCHYLFLTMYICKLDVLIVYSFLLMSPRVWKFTPKMLVYGWKMSMSNQH